MKINKGPLSALTNLLAGASLGVCFAFDAMALDTDYLQISNGAQDAGLWFELEQPGAQDWLTAFNAPAREPVRSTFALDQHFSNHSIHFGVASAPQQQMNQVGISFAGATIYGFSGSGDTTSDIFHSYNAVDDFHFHGGLRQDYEFSGYRFDYRLNSVGTVAVTQALIEADGLNDRSVDEVAVQGRWFDLSFAQVKTGGQDSGTAMAFGTRIGKYHMGLAQMAAENNARFTSFSLTTETRGRKVFGLTFEHKSNPLFEEANENRLVFSLGFRVGGGPAFYASETEAVPEGEEPKKSNTGAILVGAGAVGAAIALSSGGGGETDSKARFATQNESAKDVLNAINPQSIAENREYGGYVYRNADGSYSSTNPIKGEVASVSLPDPRSAAPSRAVTTASYHTHAATDPRYVNEEFSPQDILSDTIFGLDGYLATPRGQFRFHDVSTGKIINLGGPGTLATGQ